MAILPEPTWGEPTKSYDEQSALCIIRPSPHIVTGILLNLVRAQFADPDNIVDPKLRGYRWVDDSDELAAPDIQSTINIEPAYKFEPNALQQRPSINIERGPFGSKEFLISNGPQMSPDRNGNLKGVTKTVNLAGKHSIECCAENDMIADRLGEEVYFRMLEYKSVIKQDLNFSEFEVTVLNGLEKIPENHEHWKAKIDITWAFVYSWNVNAIAPVLKKVGQIFNVY